MTDNEALELLLKYNTQPFHIKHALTVSEVMRYFAQALGYADQADFWAQAGLLHDIDYELWPQEHCIKARELLEAAGAPQALIHAVVSHGYGITVDVKPEHESLQAPPRPCIPQRAYPIVKLKACAKNTKARALPPAAPARL